MLMSLDKQAVFDFEKGDVSLDRHIHVDDTFALGSSHSLQTGVCEVFVMR